MTKVCLFIVTRIAQWWVRLYTIGLSYEQKQARRAEIDSDIWEQRRVAKVLGVETGETALQMLERLILGIPMDLSWRWSIDGVENRMARSGIEFAIRGTRSFLQMAYAGHRPSGVRVGALLLAVVFMVAWTTLSSQRTIVENHDSIRNVTLQMDDPLPSLKHLAVIVPATGSKVWAKYGNTATLLRNDSVLVVGEDPLGDGVDIPQVYDPRSDAWSATGMIETARKWHTATLLKDGRVLVAGGKDRGGEIVASAEIYDPSDGSWTSTGRMVRARAFHEAALLEDGRLLVVGGIDNSLTALDVAEIYDPRIGAWSLTSSSNGKRLFHTLTLLRNSKMLVTGGVSIENGVTTVLNTAELYDPSTETWTPVSDMNLSRTGHTATLLEDGRVLVAGGSNRGFNLASAEIFDPVLGLWSYAGKTSYARAGHVAALTADGRVLIAGGWNEWGQPSRSADIYNPSSETWLAMASIP